MRYMLVRYDGHQLASVRMTYEQAAGLAERIWQVTGSLYTPIPYIGKFRNA